MYHTGRFWGRNGKEEAGGSEEARAELSLLPCGHQARLPARLTGLDDSRGRPRQGLSSENANLPLGLQSMVLLGTFPP